ncbi:MAG: ABC transporter ATP-binding protein [Asgard group archaeon]|nr:ABC transporter ATP-binding protein [Asgard group archaeon]
MANLIKFQNVSFTYPEKTFTLEDLSFTIESGKKYVICGQNGAGKTTLLRLLMGLEIPQSGKIIINNIELNRKTIKEIRKYIGFVFQNPDSQVFSASVYEDVAFGLRNLGVKKEFEKNLVLDALKKVNMVEFQDRSPYKLSYGQKKRVAIAGVLVMEPSIIVLDEPFSNLDYPSKSSLKEILEEQVIKKGKTVIFASHSRHLIDEWADQALFLDGGKLIYNDSAKGLNKFPLAEHYLGPL